MHDSRMWAGTLIALLAGSAAVTAAPTTVRCDYAQRIQCTAAGCRAADVGTGYLRLPTASSLLAATAAATSAAGLPTIDVCDGPRCTPIAVRAARSGAFLNLAQDGGAHFVKVAMGNIPTATRGATGIKKGDFVEVAAQFLSTVTYVGSCPAVVP